MKYFLPFFTICITVLLFSSCQRDVITASFQQSGFSPSYHNYTQNLAPNNLDRKKVTLEGDKKRVRNNLSSRLNHGKEIKIHESCEKVPLVINENKKNVKKRKKLTKHLKNLQKSFRDIPEEKEMSLPAVASFIFGLASLLLFFTLFTAPSAIVAATHSLKKIRENPDVYSGKGLAIAGLVLGIIGLALFIAIVFLWILFLLLFAGVIV